MRLNDEKEGVELKFTKKPSEEIIASVLPDSDGADVTHSRS
jgi:hypothetical protein